MKNFKIWNVLCGWLIFAVAAATYLLTIEPTASFWDCGEFISSAAKLDVGHPPGAPFFMLMGHFASLFAKDAEHIAMCVNAMSALASAFTILFLFWTITALGKKLVGGTKKLDGQPVQPLSAAQGIGVLAAGAVGALAYTFSDTFWFSAVEGEVYASSSLFTAVVFWAILKWDENADEAGSDRWLILIAYLMGLSIGVHLLNLLTIPAIVFVYYFRRYKFSVWGIVLACVASVVILAAILYGMIPGIPTLAGWFELLFVNTFHCPYNTGLFVYLSLFALSLIVAVVATYWGKSKVLMYASFIIAVAFSGIPFLFESPWIGILVIAALIGVFVASGFIKKFEISARWLNTVIVMIAVVFIGYSSYAALVIRSNADTPMDQNSPDNVFSLKYYLNREQYGDRPLFYGQVYNAPVQLKIQGNMCVPVEKVGHAQYAPNPDKNAKDKYVITGYKTSYEYMSEFKMLFPRMYSGDSRHISAYKSWGNISDKTSQRIKYDYCGQKKTEYKPTFWNNLTFFKSYQLDWMYWRYFMWNFAGRQNDLQGYGDVMKGNWICGIPFIDNMRLGDQSILPSELKNNKGHNVYFLLPLLLGLVGIVYQIARGILDQNNKGEGFKSLTLVFLLFFLTGIAIVVYLNQTPYQPRERDYAYAGSFYAFCIWIGLGAMAFADGLSCLFKNKTVKALVAVAAVIPCFGVPALMAQQNWDDHDRSHRNACRDFGANYLKSCEKQGIIFSNGDNDTFPLWYNQEVEGTGTDLRVCNLSYLQTDWYISQMKRPYYESEALPISWEQKDFVTGKNEVVWVQNRFGSLDVKQAFDWVRSDDKRTKRDDDSYLPAEQLYIPVDESVIGEGSVFEGVYTKDQLVDRLETKQLRRLTKSEMMVLEMISTGKWQRPIYFAVTVGNDYYLGLEKYFELTGLAYQVTPVASADGQPRVNTEKMYDNMMNKFKYGNMNRKGIYIDENMMRMCRTHRMMFSQLAEALYNEGNIDSCVQVLDYAEEMLPECNIPYDYTSATMGALYLQCGETEKGNAMLKKVASNNLEYLNWYYTLAQQKQSRRTSKAKREKIESTLRQVESTINHQHAVFGYVIQDCVYFDSEEVLDEIVANTNGDLKQVAIEQIIQYAQRFRKTDMIAKYSAMRSDF